MGVLRADLRLNLDRGTRVDSIWRRRSTEHQFHVSWLDLGRVQRLLCRVSAQVRREMGFRGSGSLHQGVLIHDAPFFDPDAFGDVPRVCLAQRFECDVVRGSPRATVEETVPVARTRSFTPLCQAAGVGKPCDVGIRQHGIRNVHPPPGDYGVALGSTHFISPAAPLGAPDGRCRSMVASEGVERQPPTGPVCVLDTGGSSIRC